MILGCDRRSAGVTARVWRQRVESSGSRLAPSSAGVLDPESGDRRCGPHRRPRNALSPAEEAQVADRADELQRYAGLSPKQLVPQLADEGLYLASESTMYRLQRRHGLRTKKRPMRTDPRDSRNCTVHHATRPNQVWSWDITWLPTTVRGSYLYLYLVMDVWSRRIVGWRIADRESRDVAAALISRLCHDGNVDPRGLVLHSDNGKPMRGSTMISTLQWLGVVPSFSRPHVSDDNPYSEALFRTLKHTPAYPRLPFADLGVGAALGRSLRRLVQRQASPQRDPLRHARRAPLRARARRPRAAVTSSTSARAASTRSAGVADPQLVARRARRLNPERDQQQVAA